MEKIFTEGIYLNKVADAAPAFIKTNVSIHIEKAIDWLQKNKALADEKGYIKLVGKESQQGKRYFEVDQWKPTQNSQTPEYPEEDINPDDVPF